MLHAATHPPARWKRLAERQGLLFVAWTAFGALSAAWRSLQSPATTDAPRFADSLAHILPYYWLWALLTPIVFYVATRYDLRGPAWRRAIAAHGAAALAVVTLQLFLYLFVCRALGEHSGPLAVAGVDSVRRHLGPDLLTFAVIVGAYYAFDNYRRYRDREVAASELGRRLTVAQLEVLQSRLQPHFLFNTLNTISTLVLKGERERALRALARIGDVLRGMLRTRADELVSLGEELDLTLRYLDIERERFGDLLRVQIDVPADLRPLAVPHLILQPLVENAMRHGVASRPSRGLVCIRAERTDRGLRVEVQDNGPGVDPGAARQPEGLGLENTRARLEQLYGADGQLTLANAADGGALATLEIPVRALGAGASR